MTLYEISNQYLDLLDAIANGEIPDEAIKDTLDAVQAALDDKASNIACYIKALNAEADAIKAEIDALAERQKAKQHKAERLKEYLLSALTAAGVSKIDTPRAKITIANNPPSVEIDDEDKLVDWALKNYAEIVTLQAPKINKTAIKTAITSGNNIPYCKLKVNQSLRIK